MAEPGPAKVPGRDGFRDDLWSTDQVSSSPRRFAHQPRGPAGSDPASLGGRNSLPVFGLAAVCQPEVHVRNAAVRPARRHSRSQSAIITQRCQAPRQVKSSSASSEGAPGLHGGVLSPKTPIVSAPPRGSEKLPHGGATRGGPLAWSAQPQQGPSDVFVFPVADLRLALRWDSRPCRRCSTIRSWRTCPSTPPRSRSAIRSGTSSTESQFP
jgi:hypothetical protein